jgi:hypothetical protein
MAGLKRLAPFKYARSPRDCDVPVWPAFLGSCRRRPSRIANTPTRGYTPRLAAACCHLCILAQKNGMKYAARIAVAYAMAHGLS